MYRMKKIYTYIGRILVEEGHNKINNYVSVKCSGGKYGIKLPRERGADHRD